MTQDNPPPHGTVTAPDGTPIAYWRSGPAAGAGRPLVLVHGTTSDHTTFDELLPHAARDRVVFAYDRRGRGSSGDGPAGQPYELGLELADAAAVFDEVARLEGSDVDVLGHSFGAFVAAGALPRTRRVHAAVLYSPGFGGAYPDGALERVDAAVASADLDTALYVIFREIIGMKDEDIDVLRESPVWAVRKALAWSVARECRADKAFLDDHHDALQQVAVPVLVLSGALNTAQKRAVASAVADAIPGSRLGELAGQAHTAHHSAPDELITTASEFFDAAT